MTYRKETDLAADIIQFLEKNGWEVYQEVKIGRSPVDIVAVKSKSQHFNPGGAWKEKYVWAIECKLQLSWHLLTQAREHLPYAHYVSVAVPYDPALEPKI